MNYPSDSGYTELKRKIRNIITNPTDNSDRYRLLLIWELVK